MSGWLNSKHSICFAASFIKISTPVSLISTTLCRNQERILGPCHSSSRVLNFWLYTVGCRIIEKFVSYTQICLFFTKTGRFYHLSHDNLGRNPKLLAENRHGSRKSMILICKINTPQVGIQISSTMVKTWPRRFF